ncbi:MAG: PhzF family phenazine biosynthesis protein [Leptospiraceae bacterium]|nr:PhzF family phenazine biosynthesis protein [Leptospiraceae bacterium]
MVLQYWLLDVFTEVAFQGNPLAVFPEADLPDSVMQSLAFELNLSETVFVLPPTKPDHDFRFRIFTPGKELPFAGHPIIGACCALAQNHYRTGSHSLRIEVQAGTVLVQMEKGDFWKAKFQVPRKPERTEPVDLPDMAAALGLSKEDLSDRFEIEVWSCGTPFVFVPLASEAALQKCSVQITILEQIQDKLPASEIYPFFWNGGNQIRARMFAPALGIPEDPATGAAAAALCGFLSAQSQDGQYRWMVIQGVEMGRPSQLHLDVEVGNRQALDARVSGASVMLARGEFQIPG